MKIEKQLGIYLDHASATLIDVASLNKNSETITSGFTHFEKEKMLLKTESGMHNKEQQELGTFFKKIASKILSYNTVLLFGPTDAKAELFNYLRSEHKYDEIKIEQRSTDKIDSEAKKAFVKHYFDTVL